MCNQPKDDVIGYVNKIIDMSVVDGPGNRTSIFFQGCQFNCFYCHNPETINHCCHCRVCVSPCPANALSVKDNLVVWDSSICIDCDTCISVCPHLSSPKITKYTPKELAKRIEPNILFIEGITTSGGECTLQHEFLLPFYKEIHKFGITCYSDTNGGIDFSEEQYRDFVNETDGFMLDVKAYDIDVHKKITGTDNINVLKNLEYFIRLNKLVEVRTVVIDGFPNEETIRNTCEILAKYNYTNVIYKVISYRPFGVREEFQGYRCPVEDELNRLCEIAKSYKIERVLSV